MDRILPPDSQRVILFSLPKHAFLLTFMMKFGGELSIFNYFFAHFGQTHLVLRKICRIRSELLHKTHFLPCSNPKGETLQPNLPQGYFYQKAREPNTSNGTLSCSKKQPGLNDVLFTCINFVVFSNVNHRDRSYKFQNITRSGLCLM